MVVTPNYVASLMCTRRGAGNVLTTLQWVDMKARMNIQLDESGAKERERKATACSPDT